ncbi:MULTISPECIES: hypothetical protein [Virgibacillus]|uniref:hypothetical protein n=1 Tax=Virgibacillus TaxID=84406 RepID=UPI0011307B9E|nr:MULTISPECIES: hypothetical protein [Virgibacillus]
MEITAPKFHVRLEPLGHILGLLNKLKILPHYNYYNEVYYSGYDEYHANLQNLLVLFFILA